jgi:hypothetical protein
LEIGLRERWLREKDEGRTKRVRRQAARLRALADEMDSPKHRDDLERLAREWDKTADKLESVKRRRISTD